MAQTCGSCGAGLRPESRFCPRCSTPVRQNAPREGRGRSLTPPPSPGRRGVPVPPPGTFVKREANRPGTVLYGEKERRPVLAWLVIMNGKRVGTDFRIDRESVSIGRDASCDVALDDELASRQHAKLQRRDNSFVLIDVGSANGTQVNRHDVERTELQDGDVIRIGETQLLFKVARPGPQWTEAEPEKS